MDTKNKGFEYGPVPSNEHIKEPILDVEHAPTKVEKGKKKNKKGKKIFWICCSDIEVESIEKIKEKEKELSTVDNMRNKNCFLVCFSSVKVTKG